MESKPASLEDQAAEVEEESMNFAKSLQVHIYKYYFLLLCTCINQLKSLVLMVGVQELRELRSQLHNAADYCETTFLKTKEKKTQ